jgi:DNA-3-methyladenine glycosylase II
MLATQAPFHLEATVRVLQRRPSNRVDLWEGGRYLRVLAVGGASVLVEVENHGTIDDPDVQFAIRSGDSSAATLACVRQTVRRLLGLDVDPGPFQRLAVTDPTLRPTALALRGLRPPRFVDLFETFVNVVPFQQVSLEAGVAIVGRLIEHLGQPHDYAGRRFHAFPTAQVVARAPPQSLRECGLSARKAETLQRLGRAIEAGELVEERIARMTTSDALRTLVELPGIGPWSAGLVLLRGLGRLDVFPPGDVGAERGLSALLELEPGVALSRRVERFGKFRGYLYFFGLGGSLLRKGLIHAAPNQRVRGVSLAER